MTSFDIALKMYLWAMAGGMATAALIVIIPDIMDSIRERHGETRPTRPIPWKLHFWVYIISSLVYFVFLIKYNL